jgi:PHD/YefM family antitoxin component YafN of YafNO toxin-antitoxin module
MAKIKEIKPRYITDENGEKKSIILSISDYNELMEDIDDLAKIAERREEYTISHNDLVNQLKKDGLL